jgi:para-aminobenzoate synthetase component 1
VGQHGRHADREGSREGLNPNPAHPSPRRRRPRPAAPARAVHVEPLPGIGRFAPFEVAGALTDLPGLALLESARSGQRDRWSWLAADPLAVIDRIPAAGDPFAAPRTLLARLAPGPAGDLPLAGGLIGYLGYDVGRRLERLPSLALTDQDVPELRLALHDWVVAWDHRAGTAWLAGRAVDGDVGRLAGRLAAVRERLERLSLAGVGLDEALARGAPQRFTSGLDEPAFRAAVDAVRSRIAAGDVYQVNLARRLQAPFDGDPWPVYCRLRLGDPARFAAYLALDQDARGRGSRAILSASPEPFLRVTPDGLVRADPIKGTRPRGGDRQTERALAGELLCSAKDRAENVMIVDVLRNDLGRVCRPGSVQVPRLCRLERTATVQHLVSTVTGRLLVGRGPFDLLAATFPGGSVTGAPKISAMNLIERLEPVRRGPYTGAAGWIGPDGAMELSILIRTFVADGRHLTLHVGGGITWRSDPRLEWAETEAKARGPMQAIGAVEG